MGNEHPTDLIAALALGCLDADDVERVRRHLADCAHCQAELTAFQNVTERIAEAAPCASPPDALKKRLMARIHPKQTFRCFERLMMTWPRLTPLAAAASLLLAVAIGGYHAVSWFRAPGSELHPVEGVAMIWLKGTEDAPQAIGTLIIDRDGKRGLLAVNALQPLPKEWEYQLWLIKDGQRTSGGVFSVSVKGNAQVSVGVNLPLLDFDAMGITIEPAGGSPGPTGKKVMGGRIQA